MPPKVVPGEQSNTSLVFGDQLVLKFLRRLEIGLNPELELGRFLTERKFPHAPRVVGAIEFRQPPREPMTLAVLQVFVANEGNAWQYTTDFLGRFYERALAKTQDLAAAQEVTKPHVTELPRPAGHVLDSLEAETPPLARELIGFYLERARLLGQRTAELHRALAGDPTDPMFAPEPVTDFFKHAQYQGMRGLATRTFRLLRSQIAQLPEKLRDPAERTLALEEEILERFRPIRDGKFTARRIRTHGDYHLGQVLYTGKDFVLIDFEGEPARSLSERRNKTFALRDVAGMLRSFHYASFAAAFGLSENVIPVSLEDLEPWRRFWYAWTSIAYLRGYQASAEAGPFLPDRGEEWRTVLDAYTLDKAVYELAYELNNRPEWVGIPLRGILDLVDREAAS
jgi:maltose alpha-D-glucosyltransferase/alpha-amylase